jgi:hypothetical protein
MQQLKKLITGLMIVCLPFTSMAHGYWVEVEGSHKINEPVTIKLFFGEYITGERLSGNFLDRMKEIRVFVRISGGEQQQVTMKQLADYWTGTYTPQKEGSYEIIGINDEREVQDWTKHNLGITRPVQYLKAAYQVGAAATAPLSSSFLDVTVSNTSPDTYQLRVFKNNAAFASTKVIVTHPDGEETTLYTDQQIEY